MVDIPYWPRLLDAPKAAAYLGISATTFRAGVGRVWPEPVRVGKRVLWDRAQLDAAVDRLERKGASSADPLMEALHGLGSRSAH